MGLPSIIWRPIGVSRGDNSCSIQFMPQKKGNKRRPDEVLCPFTKQMS